MNNVTVQRYICTKGHITKAIGLRFDDGAGDVADFCLTCWRDALRAAGVGEVTKHDTIELESEPLAWTEV